MLVGLFSIIDRSHTLFLSSLKVSSISLSQSLCLFFSLLSYFYQTQLLIPFSLFFFYIFLFINSHYIYIYTFINNLNFKVMNEE